MNEQQPARPAKVSLVVSDVDGTLVTKEKVLTERAREAAGKLSDAGIAFTITSGRPPRGMQMLIDALRLTAPTAAFNGALFLHRDLSVIEEHLLPAEAARSALRILESNGLDVWVYTDQDWLVRERHGPHVDHEEWTVKFPPRVVPNFDDALDRAAKIVGVSDDFGAVERCEAVMQRECGKKVSATRSQPYYLDVTHPCANKGDVIETLSRMLRIPTGEIATIGDMPNDVLMFKRSGLSIAMGNASEEVQRAAHYVTTSSEGEGFANAVERFILNRVADERTNRETARQG